MNDPPPPPPLRRTASTPPQQKYSTTTTTKTPPATSSPSPKPFKLWFYITTLFLTVTLLTLSLSSSQHPSKSWFFSLPPSLHSHFSSSRSVKIHSFPNLPHFNLFTLPNTHPFPPNTLLVHGLGLSSYAFRSLLQSLALKGLSAVAIDLPGSGFSDKSLLVDEEASGGVFGPFWEIYNEIQEKGLFWGFDQLVEKGYVDQEETPRGKGFIKREVVRPIELGSEEMGRVLGQVIETLGLAPVDLVLHDSAFGLCANWVLENTGLVRSLTLVDTSSGGFSAFPLWVLEMPVVRELVLGFGFVFRTVVESCCSKGMIGSDLEAHRALLKGGDGRKAVVGMGRNRNCSFDLIEWGSSIEAKGLPIQVIWSDNWSKEWKEEGEKIAKSLPKSLFITHSGGRWPQDDVADDLAESISRFVSRLPDPVRRKEEEPSSPKHFQKMFDETKDDENHHHGHEHVHSTAYMDEAYGLGNAWAS